eukprot:TRINITY_DN12948_c0_g1_i2.p1 TRINITY_DN12948_c0_g1~~TRINITY_DN12948_c0_g1_i2.p1  ORF type:complete len:309 (-),score=61.83 TRINITY_DN12948_c0_g1_i2:11-937(-)
MKTPIRNGVPQDWEQMTTIWNHAFTQLRVDSKSHPILLTEAPCNSRSIREKITAIMFEEFEIPAFYLSMQAVTSLYASGRVTGIIVDSGHTSTYSVPIYEGSAIQNAIHQLNIGGRDLTEFMLKLIAEKGYSLTGSSERGIFNHMKEHLTYVAINFEEEMHIARVTSSIERDYELPDGTMISLGSERFRCAEPLFNTNLLGIESDGMIQHHVHDSIMQCQSDLRKDLFHNVVLAGGNTMFPGMADRLRKEMSSLAPSAQIRTIAPPERKYSSWIGGSIMASLPTFLDTCISRTEWEENGSTIIHRKCF